MPSLAVLPHLRLQMKEECCVPRWVRRRVVEKAGKLQEPLGGLICSLGLQSCRARAGVWDVPAAALFPDELRGMKRPFKTAGRGLGFIKCNPFKNCKRFHMTWFQPHTDTEEPGLFRWSAGTQEGARCLWVLLVLQVGALLRLCEAWCPGTLCGSACDSCPCSGACAGWPAWWEVKQNRGEPVSSRKHPCILRDRGTILVILILLLILLKTKTGKVFRLLGCLMRSRVQSLFSFTGICYESLVRNVGTDAWY